VSAAAARRLRAAPVESTAAPVMAERPITALGRGDVERWIGESFRRRGYVVSGFGGSAASDGVDLGLTRNGDRFLVNFRHWQKQQIGIAVIWDLTTAIAAQGASGGFVITGGRFTREARQFAELCGISLIDGDALATKQI
jgi:restriction system protein